MVAVHLSIHVVYLLNLLTSNVCKTVIAIHTANADATQLSTVYDRNDALLDLLTTKDQCGEFLEALQRTDQQNVVNFITQNGGQTQ